MGDGVYPRQVILRPAHTNTHAQTRGEGERECIFVYVHGYIPGQIIDYIYRKYRNRYDIYKTSTLQDIPGRIDA